MRLIDLRGLTFGRWVVLEMHPVRRHRILWLCQCACGTTRLVRGNHLRWGNSIYVGVTRQAAAASGRNMACAARVPTGRGTT
jgi:hypothetical protein